MKRSPPNFAGRTGLLLAAGVLTACSPKPVQQPVTGKELLLNGGFEIPATPMGAEPVGSEPPAPRASGGTTHIIHIDDATREKAPPGFGWKIESGDIDVVGYGYDSGGGNLFLGAMAEGNQHLDLDGHRNSGTIAQTFPTEEGGVYALAFAYANNPDPDAGSSHRFDAQVSVVDAASKESLLPPLNITHHNSTLSDYHWVRVGPTEFTARGNATILRFVSQDGVYSAHGLLLDDVSVKIISRPVFLTGGWKNYALMAAGAAAVLFFLYLFVTQRRQREGQPAE